MKPRAAPVLKESSTWTAFQISADGLKEKETATAAVAALSTSVANRNAGRPLRALPFAT